MAIMLITHDLGVVAEMCDDVVVMYARPASSSSGRSSELFTRAAAPLHARRCCSRSRARR